MLDPAIEDFFAERKDGWLKKNLKASMSDAEISEKQQECENTFALAQWIPNAAKRAGQISLSTHPCTFSHPSARKNKNGSVSATIANAKQANDGFLRSGNVAAEPDALGNAAALDVYKFLTLEMQDKQTLLEHINAETELAKTLLTISNEPYQTLRDGFLEMAAVDDTVVTSSKIKQVYFPIFYDDEDYHLLSLLTPSGLLFEMRRRIDVIRFSEQTKALRELRRKGEYSEVGYQEIYDITSIGFGGTKPQNISVLNNQNAGRAYLLPSLPPVINIREMRLPKTNFFADTQNPWHAKETFKAFHGLISLPKDKRGSRFIEYRDNLIQEYVDYILVMMWKVRRAFELENSVLPTGLSKYQQTWLFPNEQTQRDNMDDWLLVLIPEIARCFIEGYKKINGNKALSLGNDEFSAIADVVAINKELLR
ncbi:type I-F CRISPR-associated protein Csy1 [Providencia burhodogranariea]|uniref:CRISPR-associated protein, Csy1 family n=1 Tax=Providencia burhodogranariea DSM 19968 TaxID=1141662 RepID=K8WXU9_9GAMM|nr:CRISPR-associated protein, Csy1 family [Providencia burhodogranariea DSM 19968]